MRIIQPPLLGSTEVGQTIIEGLVTLSYKLDQSENVAVDFDAQLALEELSGFSSDGGWTTESNVSLGIQLNETPVVQWDIDGDLTLNYQLDTNETVQIDLDAAVTFAQALGLAPSASATFEQALILGALFSQSQTVERSLDAALSLAFGSGLSSSTQWNADGAITLDHKLLQALAIDVIIFIACTPRLSASVADNESTADLSYISTTASATQVVRTTTTCS